MILDSGHWLGRGSVLAEGQSRGGTVECHVLVQRDDGGATITGTWQLEGAAEQDFQVRLAGNEVGTYSLQGGFGADGLAGTAKMDSPPNLGLLWNASGSLHATFSLFPVARGYGFRGFVRDAGGPGEARLFTWEVAFSLKQERVTGGNVVTLRRRRR